MGRNVHGIIAYKIPPNKKQTNKQKPSMDSSWPAERNIMTNRYTREKIIFLSQGCGSL